MAEVYKAASSWLWSRVFDVLVSYTPIFPATEMMRRLLSISSVLLALFHPSSQTTDIDTARTRRYSVIVGGTTGATSISSWLSTLGENGKWPDDEINYTTGCDGQTASWPAQEHWSRINTFAAAWHGGLKNALQYANDTNLRASISLAMNYWFANDFTDPSCIDSGGTDACPCGTPGFWNTNWFSNIILIPAWVGQACLLLGSSLDASDLANCTRMTQRAYNTFNTGINGVSAITGANTLDIASVGVDLGLLTSNESLLTDAYGRVHAEVTIKNGTKADGIRADGSFGQHAGILYNGNYGRDYANDVFDFELIAGGTEFEAGSTSRDAFSVFMTANEWMIFRNSLTGVSHWDYSVIGRYISLPVSDNQSSASIKMNLSQLAVLGQEWNSASLTSIYNDLMDNSSDANIGPLNGDQMFYTNDYMVQRGPGYVSTLKMYSKRTLNSECTNSQNNFGFHLSDGTLYTYLTGNEYEDIFASWDWNLIPGITVDYGATALNCSGVRHTGTQTFVGGASDGNIGIAAMRYETPTSKTLSWRKTWFFLPDTVQFVMVARISSTTSAPVFSVLDQRKHDGDVYVSGVVGGAGNYTNASSLWHAGIGYTFNTSNPATSLSVQLGNRTGSWGSIGTSSKPDTSVDIFAAWLDHVDITQPISYTIYPATSSYSNFQEKIAATRLEVVRNDGSISALLDVNNNVAMIAYWEATGGSVIIPSTEGVAPVKVVSSGNLLVILHMDDWTVTVSDPTQMLSNATLTFSLASGSTPTGWSWGNSLSRNVSLPSGGNVGASVTMSLS